MSILTDDGWSSPDASRTSSSSLLQLLRSGLPTYGQVLAVRAIDNSTTQADAASWRPSCQGCSVGGPIGFQKVFPMSRSTALFRAMLVSAGALALAACLPSDGDESERAQNVAPSPVPAPTPSPTPSPSPSPSPTPSPAPAPTPTPAPSPASITVSWNANTEADLRGYRVYFGTSSGTYQQVRGAGLDAGRSTTFTISNLRAGATYYIAVTGYDTAGNESAFSGEVSGAAK